jgi:hypothetical protein
MPRRNWKAPKEGSLKEHLDYYPCSEECCARTRMMELFTVSSTDIDNDTRANGAIVPVNKQIVNGTMMRKLIAKMLLLFSESISSGHISRYPTVSGILDENASHLMGLVLGAITDLCFNMEYVRRSTDARWSYCSKAGDHRLYYPYLGVCPHCMIRLDKPVNAALGISKHPTSEEKEIKARYFGNKIESHHVGRIGERVIVYILDLLTKSKYPESKTTIVFDDQHEVDCAFFFDGIGVLAQIKSSPLVLLPIVSVLQSPLTQGVDNISGLPLAKPDHTFTSFAASEHELGLYFSIDDSSMTLGMKTEDNWPYSTFTENLDIDKVMKVIENWVAIYHSFEIPKRKRSGDDVKRAYLTAGWGAPIDDNKTKSGLARSDNMMKGTYASLKYGAYYVQECKRKTLRTVLLSNIDPVHQYEDYLENLQDIRWGHDKNFSNSTSPEGSEGYFIDEEKLTYLFDAVFTFNRQILNDEKIKIGWNLNELFGKLAAKSLDDFLIHWSKIND